MELHIYKYKKAPSGRIVKLDELECTYNIKDTIRPSSQLCADVLGIFPTSEIENIVKTVMGIITLMSKTGALTAKKNDLDINIEAFFDEENSEYSEMAMKAFLSLIQKNFNKAIDATQLILEQQQVYLTREQVSVIEPQEMAKVFLSLFRFLLQIYKIIK